MWCVQCLSPYIPWVLCKPVYSTSLLKPFNVWTCISQCTIGRQVVNKAAISHTVYYGQASGTQLLHKQCTISKQVTNSYFTYRALLASRWYTAFSIQCTMAKQVIHSYLAYSELWAIHIFHSFLRTFEVLVYNVFNTTNQIVTTWFNTSYNVKSLFIKLISSVLSNLSFNQITLVLISVCLSLLSVNQFENLPFSRFQKVPQGYPRLPNVSQSNTIFQEACIPYHTKLGCCFRIFSRACMQLSSIHAVTSSLTRPAHKNFAVLLILIS